MRLLAVAVALTLTAVATSPAWAFTCPVVIKQAEDLIKKAEAGKPNAETRPFIDEAKKFLSEARAHHEGAKTKKDHGDAVRKAKIAAAYAEEAIVLASP